MALNPIQRAITARKPKPPTASTAAPETQDYSALDPYGETTKQKVSELTAPSEQRQQAALDKRFQSLEQKLFGQELGQGEREADILARKFARIGPTGREEKAFEVAGKAAGRRLEEGQETITQEKMAQQEALQQTLEGRRLQAAERIAGQDFTAEQAEIQRTFDEGQNALNRELISAQIAIDEKTLAMNTALSLSNLAQVEDPTVMKNIIDALKAAGLDMTYYDGLLAKMQQQKEGPAAASTPAAAATLAAADTPTPTAQQPRMPGHKGLMEQPPANVQKEPQPAPFTQPPAPVSQDIIAKFNNLTPNQRTIYENMSRNKMQNPDGLSAVQLFKREISKTPQNYGVSGSVSNWVNKMMSGIKIDLSKYGA